MATPPTARDVKPFVGSADFARSRDFYVALGWTLLFDTGEGLACLELAGSRFYLQDYYAKEWCENSMLHVSVDDAAAWHTHVSEVLASGDFAPGRVATPKHEPYGALVTYVWDPAGVLLHLAQSLDEPA